MLRPSRLLLVAALLSICGRVALSADQGKKPPKYAVLDPAQAGEDFWLQGEYVGSSYLAGCGCRTVGLQVVALGDGQFAGVLYQGGLPGAGWDRSSPHQLQGQRQGPAATLTGSEMTIALDGRLATVYSLAGQPLGQLCKTTRLSPTMGAAAPANALVLFDGREPRHLEGAQIGEDGLLMPGGTTTMPVGDFRMHLEFRTPYMPFARGQARGNSGVYIQRRYEVQILDSFGLEGVANECGGLYKQQQPEVNMALPPLSWQTYDIYFTAARWSADGATKVANARITVYHNGVAIHCNREITGKTGAGKAEGPEPSPIHLQFHGDPVRYRNVWIVLPQEPPPSCRPAAPCLTRRPLLRRPLLQLPLLRRGCGGLGLRRR